MKTDKIVIFIPVIALLLLLLAAGVIRGQNSGGSKEESGAPPLSGEALILAKTVIAGGGALAENQASSVQTTAGQAIAGGISTGGRFSLNSGFWTPDNFMPTSATVTVGGRVQTAQGAGIRNAQVTIMFASGETRATRSGAFGYFRFGDVEVGATYIFTISAKRFVFSEPTQVLTVNEERDDIDFVADEN